ncbi:hypothetical protein [Agriterribacter sp.]|uniref:hypothetical protein n=1 Tax=Agriterribacter sp. TaxID=2821509 RepID=UPI002CFE1725|nr:hypothetical protein [Agriterribacter sp.]HTN05876.1 hypothetical protein [Agriterribacter sp.]
MTGNTQSPAGRLHALWTIEGLDELRAGHIIKALHDTIAGIRENAIRLAEPFLTTNPELANELYALQNNDNARVRFQLACTPGYINTTETLTAITLNNYGGQKTTIARHDIQSLKALGMSAMPAGLEKQITPQQMSNLLAFIQEAK